MDLDGNLSLIDAARRAEAQRFVFVSADTADENSPVDFFRYKARAERHLRESGLDYIIVRPGAFMDVWANIVAGDVVTKGVATIFGKGDNPVNFIARDDVADFIAAVVMDSSVTREAIKLAGPENLTLVEVAEKFERHVGRQARHKHIPVVAMRLLGTLLKPINPVLSRMMRGGVLMATETQTMDSAPVQRRFPGFRPRTMDDWLKSH